MVDSPPHPASQPAPSHNRPWYRRIGPGLVTACVVIGPGSIMTSSTIGANDHYSLLWVVLVSVLFMLLFMTLGAKLGAVGSAPPCDLVRQHAGTWLASLLGVSVLFISAAFQSGNNIGVAAALGAYIESKFAIAALLVLFNALAISFLFVFKEQYQMLERVMSAFVALMLVSFAINLFQLKPDPVAMAQGLLPSLGKSGDILAVLGLVGTTFVITAAFYQAYLVRQKGWSVADLPAGMIDARVGAFIMFLITVMIMSTAAAGLYTGQPVKLADPIAVATSLEQTFGPTAKIVFCLGLFSAAYSSFLINSMVGGFIAADGLGLGSRPNDRWPRWLTTTVLLIGMLVGLAVLLLDFDRTPTIIAAQAVTVIAAPLVAGTLLWLTSSRAVMGEHVNPPATIVLGCLGLLLLVAMAGKTAVVDLPPKISVYFDSPDRSSP